MNILDQTSEQEREKRLMAMGQMAASLAHEIRNPLGSMELYCTLLKKDLENLPASFKLADQIHSGIRRLDRIITNCLQFSRDLSPRRAEVFDTAELLSDTLSYMRPRAEKAGVCLEFEEIGSEDVYVDPHLVNQAALNLVLNAIEASEASGTEQPWVKIESNRSSADAWFLSVRDNGTGIARDERERVFDPFVTSKQEGTGLGLAIVHSIARAHDGTVAISDEPGGGACVTIEFPTMR